MFENLRYLQPAQLIGFVRSIDWASIDYATRLVVVHELNTAITAFREARGLPPIRRIRVPPGGSQRQQRRTNNS